MRQAARDESDEPGEQEQQPLFNIQPTVCKARGLLKWWLTSVTGGKRTFRASRWTAASDRLPTARFQKVPPKIRLLVSQGQMSDQTGAALLLDALPRPSTLIGDKGYDSNAFRAAWPSAASPPASRHSSTASSSTLPDRWCNKAISRDAAQESVEPADDLDLPSSLFRLRSGEKAPLVGHQGDGDYRII